MSERVASHGSMDEALPFNPTTAKWARRHQCYSLDVAV